MSRWQVWAPRARSVALRFEPDGQTVAMVATGGGHFQLEDSRIAAGQRYWFSLDGGPPRPDPRSQSQPDGVHGPSQWVDLAGFQWTDAGFQARPLGSAVIYELHVGTFTTKASERRVNIS
jgi:maltooligosyltrehalose trehalohydrolase